MVIEEQPYIFNTRASNTGILCRIWKQYLAVHLRSQKPLKTKRAALKHRSSQLLVLVTVSLQLVSQTKTMKRWPCDLDPAVKGQNADSIRKDGISFIKLKSVTKFYVTAENCDKIWMLCCQHSQGSGWNWQKKMFTQLRCIYRIWRFSENILQICTLLEKWKNARLWNRENWFKHQISFN